MKGYHYTAYWGKVRKQGLKLHTINKEELLPHFLKPVKGIWLWKDRLEGISHVGSILFQMFSKNEQKVALLEVGYELSDILLTEKGDRIILQHQGTMGNFQYHDYTQEAYILINKVPPSRIKCLGVYNFMEAFN